MVGRFAFDSQLPNCFWVVESYRWIAFFNKLNLVSVPWTVQASMLRRVSAGDHCNSFLLNIERAHGLQLRQIVIYRKDDLLPKMEYWLSSIASTPYPTSRPIQDKYP